MRGVTKYLGGDMRFNDPTLYGRDDETDEYSDSGAYGESLEEDLEEEEEEEEEPVLVEEDDEIPVVPAREPVRAPEPVTPSGGGGSQGGPPKKASAKKAQAKKKAAKKPAKKVAKKKKKAAKKPARKKPAAKKKKAAKKLSVGFSCFFPIRNVSEEHARADDIFQRSSGPLQCAFNVLEGLNRLRIRITRADDLAIGSSRSCTRNVDICTHANRTRVTDNRFPWCSA